MIAKATLTLSDLDDAKLEAVIETMFLAAHADGDVGVEERAHVQKALETLAAGRADLPALLLRAEKLGSGDRDERLAAVKSRLPDAASRELALASAVQVMAADGIIRTSERELIMDLADGLGVDRDRAADMVTSAG